MNYTAILMTLIICTTGIELLALYKGIDGAVTAPILAIFGVLAGAISKVIYDKAKST